jgi:predicted O-linked N-acetylglucosamine transferase (SPINDLY family)
MESAMALIRKLGLAELPSSTEGEAEGGGDEVVGSHVYLVPQSIMKFHPSFDEVLRLILEQDPRAVVGIVDAVGSPVQRHILKQRFLATMPAQAAARIKILAKLSSTDEWLQLLKGSHVMLDPFPFGGGVTTLEGLAVCTPVVTCPSLQSVPQLAGGMLRKMGMGKELIVPDKEQFVRAALAFGTNQTRRTEVSARICERHSAIYEETATVGEWSRFLRTAVAAARA